MGQLVSVENDIYKIQTAHMGVIQVPGPEIIQISAAPEPSSTVSSTPETVSSSPNEQLKTQATQLQQQFLTDPAVMADIKAIVEDPEVASILSDPQFVNDMLSYDPNRIQGNPKTQAMMQHPKIQQLMNKMQSKLQTRNYSPSQK